MATIRESAYAHLGNAQQIITFLLTGLPEHTQTVTVSVDELNAIQSRITKARDEIRTHYLNSTEQEYV